MRVASEVSVASLNILFLDFPQFELSLLILFLLSCFELLYSFSSTVSVFIDFFKGFLPF